MPANLKVAKWLCLPSVISQFPDKPYTAKVKSIRIILFIKQSFSFLKKNWPTLKNIILTNSIRVYLLLSTKNLDSVFQSNERIRFKIILLLLMVLMCQTQPTLPVLFIEQSTWDG